MYLYTFYSYNIVQFKNLLNVWNLYFAETAPEYFKEFTYLKKHLKYKYYNKNINFHITIQPLLLIYFLKTVRFAGFYKIYNFLLTQTTIFLLFTSKNTIKTNNFLFFL